MALETALSLFRVNRSTEVHHNFINFGGKYGKNSQSENLKALNNSSGGLIPLYIIRLARVIKISSMFIENHFNRVKLY